MLIVTMPIKMMIKQIKITIKMKTDIHLFNISN